MIGNESPFMAHIEELIVSGKITPEKKVYCFGAGNAALTFLDELLTKVKIEKVLDNNTMIHGSKIKGIEVVSPDVLCNETKEKIVVLILSMHGEAMGKQLNAMGLTVNRDYFDLFLPLERYYYIKKFNNTAMQFERFLKKIPVGYFENIPIIKKEHIAIVCGAEAWEAPFVFAVTQALLLRSQGYRVTIIIDTQKSFEGYLCYQGIERLLNSFWESMLSLLRASCSDIKIKYINAEGAVDLDDADYTYIEKAVGYVLKWMSGFLVEHYEKEWRINGCICDKKIIAKETLSSNLSYIKGFFEKNRFDTLNVFTGVHKNRNLYLYVAKQHNMHVSSYDTAGPNKIMYSTRGISSHGEDIPELILHDYFNKEEKNKILALAKEHFAKYIKSTEKDRGIHYQAVEYISGNRIEDPCDIVIPLNIAWDASALFRDDLFENEMDWLDRTLGYILQHTEATVMVRAHPAERLLKQFTYVDRKKDLPILNSYGDRIRYVEADEKINTYQYIENCKLVLPYTSTIGIEAALLGKNVIVHTNVYYKDLGFVYKASSVEDYFASISYYLVHPEGCICKNTDNAYLAYYFFMNRLVHSEFCLENTSWMQKTFDELKEDAGVKKIIDVVAKGIPPAYYTVKEMI